MLGKIWKKKEREKLLDIDYATKRMLDLSDDDIKECSELFSNSYGKYNEKSDRKPGQQVAMKESYYKKNYCREDIYIATARDGNTLVGHAIYIRKKYEGYGIMTWVLQLVVNRDYRRQGIASTLLRSIWGFSDDYAWGLASANPCTVRTLESATFRKCEPAIIQRNLEPIKLIGKDTSFVPEDAYVVNDTSSQVNTHFFVDNSEFGLDLECEKSLGALSPGYEWLAFTFKEQAIQQDKYEAHFNDFVSFSEKKLKDAYSRMDMVSHGWTKGTQNEVDFLVNTCKNGKLLDLGCGIGRHSLALAERGFCVKGVDFSKKHIQHACEEREKRNIEQEECEFVCSDVRNYVDETLYDGVVCLYDVIGSFPDEKDNICIIETARRQLKKGGLFIVSVMNMELTEHIVPNDRKGSLKQNPDILMKLPPSNIMQSNGDIFNPEYLAIDTDMGVVFRKEQFSGDDALAAEYVIRDKRYTKKEICGLIENQGFDILNAFYARAGHFDEPLEALDIHAKEICIIAKKR